MSFDDWPFDYWPTWLFFFLQYGWIEFCQKVIWVFSIDWATCWLVVNGHRPSTVHRAYSRPMAGGHIACSAGPWPAGHELWPTIILRSSNVPSAHSLHCLLIIKDHKFSWSHFFMINIRWTIHGFSQKKKIKKIFFHHKIMSFQIS